MSIFNWFFHRLKHGSRRRLNVKFLACLVAGAVPLVVGVHFLHGFQARRNAGELLRRATQAREQKEPERAAEHLQRYLQLVPDDSDALATLGLTRAEFAASPRERLRAFMTLENALRRSPGREDVRRQLVDLAMELRRFPDAVQHLNNLIQATPNSAELEQLLGECLEAHGKYSEAADSFERAIAHDPHRVKSYEGLAGVWRRHLERPQEADLLMERMIAANDRSFQAYVARARYRQEFRLPSAAEDRERALELAGEANLNDADDLLAAAELAQDVGRFDEARRFLERGVEQYPKDERVYRLWAQTELRAGKPEDAQRSLERGIEAITDKRARTELYSVLAELLIQQSKLADVPSVIRSLRETAVSTGWADYFEAQIALQNERWAEATRALELVRPHIGLSGTLGTRINLQLGQCYQQLGDMERQLEAYRRAVKNDPLSAPARSGLAATLLAMGRRDEALAEYRMMAASAGRLAVARLLIARNLTVPERERRWAEVEQTLDEAAEAAPDSVEVVLLRAELLAARGRLDAAQAVLEQARDGQPDHVVLWTALAAAAELRGKRQEALSILDTAEGQLGDRVELRLARAAIGAARGTDSRAALVRLEQNLDQYPAEEQLILLSGLANAHVRAGNSRDAERLWKRLAERQPSNLHLRMRLFDLAIRNREEAQLKQVIAEMRRIEGDGGTQWRYGEAARLLNGTQRGDSARLAEARQYLSEVVSRRPAWSRVPLLQAQIDEREGDVERALESYLRAIELGERQPDVLRRAFQLLYERGQYAEANRLLQKLEVRTRLGDDPRRLAVSTLLGMQEAEPALELAALAASEKSSDYRDRVWLAQVYWVAGRKDEAESRLRHAVKLAGDIPYTWVALVYYFARTGQHDKAEAAIAEAGQKLPPGRPSLALAQCFELIARPDQAEVQYRAALDARPQDVLVLRTVANYFLRTGRARKAEPFLRELIDPELNAPEDFASWAQRNLTAILAMRLNRRAEAIQLCEDLIARQLATEQDRFLLVKLYEATGEWPKARALMVRLLDPIEGGLPYVARFVRNLLQRGETDEAEAWVKRLEELAPDSYDALEAKSRLCVAQGRPQEAVASTRAYTRRDGLEPTEQTKRVGQIAVLLEQLDLQSAAEEKYREYVAKQPDQLVVLMGFLARRGRLQEAIDLCEQVWRSGPSEMAAAASVAVLRQGGATEEMCEGVARQLQGAIEKEPTAIAMMLYLADVRDLQGRFVDAESLYREILKQEERNVVALNNLAWLLAQRSESAAEALPLIDLAIELTGPAPEMLDTRAAVFMALGEKEKAVKDLQDALAEVPKPTWHFHLAQVFLGMENREAAKRAIETARSNGLDENLLHPLERSAYKRLLASLEL